MKNISRIGLNKPVPAHKTIQLRRKSHHFRPEVMQEVNKENIASNTKPKNASKDNKRLSERKTLAQPANLQQKVKKALPSVSINPLMHKSAYNSAANSPANTTGVKVSTSKKLKRLSDIKGETKQMGQTMHISHMTASSIVPPSGDKKKILQKIEYWSHKIANQIENFGEAKYQIDSLMASTKDIFALSEDAFELLCSIKALAFVSIDMAYRQTHKITDDGLVDGIPTGEMDSHEESDSEPYILQPQSATQLQWLKPGLRERLKLNLSSAEAIRKKEMLK